MEKVSILRSQLAISTALVSVLVGYGRRAYAANNCSATAATYACSGSQATTQSFTANNSSVSTVGPFNINTSSSRAITVSGDGALSFTDNYPSIISSTDPVHGYGLEVNATGDAGTTPGSVTITTGPGSSITGGNTGVVALTQSGTTGNLSVTTGTGSSVTGGLQNGILAEDSGSGGLSVRLGTDSSVTATGASSIGIFAGDYSPSTSMTITTGAGSSVKGGIAGIDVSAYGHGPASITADGYVGGGVLGIGAVNLNNGTQSSLTITTGAGSNVTGGNNGIVGLNTGGALSITANGAVTGTNVYGIQANNAGPGTTLYGVTGAGTNLTITTGTGSNVTGGVSGIRAVNSGTGYTKVNVGGAVTGTTGPAIVAYNTSNGTYVNIETSTTSNVSAGNSNIANDTKAVYGINQGSGGLSITIGGAVTTTTATGTYNEGVVAKNFGQGDLTVTTDVGSTIKADGAIIARNYTAGNLIVTTNGNVDGDYARSGGTGIWATNHATSADSDLTITTGANTTVTGGNGIIAQNYSTGALSITANGNVSGIKSGGGSYGIGAVNTGTSLTINTGAGTNVTGDTGIFAYNSGTGVTSVTADGAVTGTIGEGIDAYSEAAAASLSVTTGSASSVTGGADGIDVSNAGTGLTQIAVSGVVQGNTGNGILVNNSGSTAGATINTYTGSSVTGATVGIGVNNFGGGPLSISVGGDVTGTADIGVDAYNGTTASNASVVTAAGSVVQGGQVGVQLKSYGAGPASVAVDGTATGTGIDGISLGSGPASTSLAVTTGTQAVVTGGWNGIATTNQGSGATTITTNGQIHGVSYDGVVATNESGEGTDLQITTGQGSSVTGGEIGVGAFNYGTGATTIITNGAVTGTTQAGIYAKGAGTDLTVTTNASSVVTGGTTGIQAGNAGTGALNITANGDVTGTTGYGIFGYNLPNGGTAKALTITTASGTTVAGGSLGIYANNYSTGATTINVNGNVSNTDSSDTSTRGIGIYAKNIKYAGQISVTTAAGTTVTGTYDGIKAAGTFNAVNTGTAAVTVNGNVSGGFAGVVAVSSGATSVTTSAGSVVTGGADGILGGALGAQSSTITVNGDVTGTSSAPLQNLGHYVVFQPFYSRNGGPGPSYINAHYLNGGNGILGLTGSGGNVAISVGPDGLVQGSTDGILVSSYSTNAALSITNAGTIQNLSGAPSALAIATLGAPVTITNTGLITGTVNLGDPAPPNSVANDGTWNTAGGTNWLDGTVTTGGNGVVTNNGAIIAASGGAASPVTTTFNGVGTFTNAGLITMQNGVAGDRTVITGNFAGQNGAVRLDTVLGSDGSPSDELIFNGGTATGSTKLYINNAGGTGALTVANGIQVVGTANGATTSGTAFTLGNRVAAGAYEYELYDGGNAASGGNPNDQNWYLRSTLIPTTPTAPTTPTGPTAPAIPDYRVEVPVDMAVPLMASQFGLAMLDTLDDRVGSQAPDMQGTNNGGTWVRILGQVGSRDDGHTLSSFDQHGPAYNWSLDGIQAGLDVYRKTHDDGSNDVAGAYVGMGRITGDVDQTYGTAKAGSVSMSGYSFGAYWTHYAAKAWYTDAVFQATSYDEIHARSVAGQTLSSGGSGYLVSLEGGWKFDYAHGLALTPEAQLIYQNLNISGGTDDYGRIAYSSSSALYARIGGRVTKVWNLESGAGTLPIMAWGRVNVWHNFNAQADTTFSSLSGANPVTLGSDLGDSWTQFSLGAVGQLSQRLSAFASADLSVPFVGHGDVWTGRLGVKYVW